MIYWINSNRVPNILNLPLSSLGMKKQKIEISWAKSGLPLVLVKYIYWTTAVLILLHVVCGCFDATAAKMNSCNTNSQAHDA